MAWFRKLSRPVFPPGFSWWIISGLPVIRDKTAFPMSSKSLTTSLLLGHFWRHRNRISHRCSIAFPVSPRS